MAYYSLVASLPHLKIGDEPPFTTEEYLANCAQWITPREIQTLQHVLLFDPNSAPCPLCQAWNNLETQLRNATARHRAQQLGVDYTPYQKPHDGFSGTIEKLVADALSHTNPAELEEGLDRARWQLAEDLIGQNPFDFKKILAYGIQLQIVERWNRMDIDTGTKKLEAIITATTDQQEVMKK